MIASFEYLYQRLLKVRGLGIVYLKHFVLNILTFAHALRTKPSEIYLILRIKAA